MIAREHPCVKDEGDLELASIGLRITWLFEDALLEIGDQSSRKSHFRSSILPRKWLQLLHVQQLMSKGLARTTMLRK